MGGGLTLTGSRGGLDLARLSVFVAVSAVGSAIVCPVSLLLDGLAAHSRV